MNWRDVEQKIRNSFKRPIQIPTVIIAHPDSEELWYYRNGTVYETLLPLPQKPLVVSYVTPKGIIYGAHNFSASEEIDEDDIEIQAFESMGLDQSMEYRIGGIELYADDSVRHYELLGAEQPMLARRFGAIAKRFGHIDYIAFAPLLYHSLYRHALISDQGTHLFVHLGIDDTMVTIYHNGRYRYSKSLKNSLRYIHERYCEYTRERCTFDHFVVQLRGCDPTVPAEEMARSVGELFTGIGDLLAHARRLLHLRDNFDLLYLSSEIKQARIMDYYALSYLGLNATPLEPKLPITIDTEALTNPSLLMALTLLETNHRLTEHDENSPNFTLFPPKPPLHKRDGGRLVLSVAASAALAVGVPLFLWLYEGLYLSNVLENAKRVEQLSRNDLLQWQTKLGELNRQEDILRQAITAEQKGLDDREALISTIHTKSRDYLPKAATLTDFLVFFGRYNAKIEVLSFNNERLFLKVYANEAKRLTGLIRDFVQSHLAHEIRADKIEYNTKTKEYLSLVEVRMR